MLGRAHSLQGQYLYAKDSTLVIEQTAKKDFRTRTEKARLVEFYSPSCGACENFKVTYIKLAKELKKIGKDKVEVYAVSCTATEANKELCNSSEIRGYPTLMAFPAGETEGIHLHKSEMGGNFIADKIAKFLKVDKDDEEDDATSIEERKNMSRVSRRVSAKQETEQQGNNNEDNQDDEKEMEGEEGKEDDVEDEEKDEIDEEDTERKMEKHLDEKDEDEKEEDEEKDDEEVDEDEDKKDKKEEDKNDEEDDEEEDKNDEEDDEEKDNNDEEMDNNEEMNDKDDKEDKDEEDAEDNDKSIADEGGGLPGTAFQSDFKALSRRNIMKADETKQTPRKKAPHGGNPDAVSKQRTSGGAKLTERAGAAKALQKMRNMDKWKDLIEKKKKELDQKKKSSKLGSLGRRVVSSTTKTKKPAVGPGGNVKLDAPAIPGTTKLMRAHTPGTAEHQARKKAILERIAKSTGKRVRPMPDKDPHTSPLVNKSKLPFKKEPKRPSLVRKQLEKVPVVKRMFQMIGEEELINDATLSFITGLDHGVFMSNDQLTQRKKDALMSYLELMSVSLPAEWGLHVLIDDLMKRIDFISLSIANLRTVLKKHPPARVHWGPNCSRSNNAFSCGMWKLLHITTLGVAEHQGGLNLVKSGLVDPSTRTFNPAEAAEVFRDYIANFFGCDECREHFLEKYDSCDFRRCDRLADDVDGATADDWKQLALWLWEVHNDVNILVEDKKANRIQKRSNPKNLDERREDAIKVLFPSLEDCLVCFNEGGEWNEDSVFEYLERTYWDTPDSKYDRLLTSRKIDDGEDPSGGGVIWYLLLIAVGIAFAVRKHINNLTFHRHSMRFTSVIGMKQKIGDAVSGKKRTA